MKKKNILLYFTDQQRADTCGCYGQELPITPVLDQLAAEGTRFDLAFTPQPVCGPCRAMFQTGKWATDIGCFRNNIMLPANVKPLGAYMEEAGYETAYVGKWHLASDGELEKKPTIDHTVTAIPRELRGGYTGSADEIDCHEEHSDEEGKPAPIWKAALRHTLEIFVFIFVFSLVFGLIVEGVGEDVFADALGRMGFFQPVVAALVGLIPNCAASVLLTQLYVEGALRFSSLVAGLCTGAGVGLAVLWRANPSWKQNLFITGLTWAAGAAVGVGIQIVVAIFG